MVININNPLKDFLPLTRGEVCLWGLFQFYKSESRRYYIGVKKITDIGYQLIDLKDK